MLAPTGVFQQASCPGLFLDALIMLTERRLDGVGQGLGVVRVDIQRAFRGLLPVDGQVGEDDALAHAAALLHGCAPTFEVGRVDDRHTMAHEPHHVSEGYLAQGPEPGGHAQFLGPGQQGLEMLRVPGVVGAPCGHDERRAAPVLQHAQGLDEQGVVLVPPELVGHEEKGTAEAVALLQPLS
ncbi:MAG: hypothetical protein A2051_10330 [Desulfovibrionales bacterium GWA2_65_9]|nr:MAG: hypothetical protein A2051_10330 [Desulfovibrionales bacterium GWA2_65_9]